MTTTTTMMMLIPKPIHRCYQFSQLRQILVFLSCFCAPAYTQRCMELWVLLVSISHITGCCPNQGWHRLVGLVVKASASRAEDPGFESRLPRDFSRGPVITVT